VGALTAIALLTASRPAAACDWYDPACWAEEGFDYIWDGTKGALDLAWDVITLDPKEAWDDFKNIAYNSVCGNFTVLSVIIGNGIEADFNECAGPPHPIEPDVLAKLRLYFKSSLDSVRIHESCNLDGDVTPGHRAAITFGEHIYFKKGAYHPRDNGGFALLAHELTHVLQYRKKGFSDFICEYGLKCRFGADKSCAIEQNAYKYQALVLEDRNRDQDGVFTCPLNDQYWDGDNVASHNCNTNAKFLACNSNTGGPKPSYCNHVDNCPNRFNQGQEDFNKNGIGNVCDEGWTSDAYKSSEFQKHGDFDGDHKADILVQSAWGIGILTYNGSSLTSLMLAPNGTMFGGWQYNSALDHIVAVADFNRDYKADILITGPGGIGILTYDGSSLTSLMVAPNGTSLGGWPFQADANRMVGTADFNQDGRQDIVVASAWGIGILTYDGSSLTPLMLAPTGTRFGSWLFDSLRNNIEGFGDFDADGKDDLLIRSDWGMGILTLRDTTLTSLMRAPNGTEFGNWTLRKTDRIAGIGRFSGGLESEILMISDSGLALVGRKTWDASQLTTIMHASNGARLGQWLLDTRANSIAGIGLGPSLRDDIVIRSPWGIGILEVDGSWLTTRMLAPSGTRLGGWLYNSAADQILGVNSFAGGFSTEILITSKWGIGILANRSSTPQSLTLESLMLAPNGTRFGGWIFDSAANRVGIDHDSGAQSVPTWASGLAH
jgi:hypothetical protein